MSVSDIELEMQEIYGINLSTSAISIITGKVSQAVSEWQNRPLESLYMIVWMDGIVFKVRENGKVINKTVYLCVGLNKDGLKEVLGMWVGKNESAAFWMGVLTDLKARGVEDKLLTTWMDLQKPSRVYFLPLPLKYVWYIKLGIPVAMWFGKKKRSSLLI